MFDAGVLSIRVLWAACVVARFSILCFVDLLTHSWLEWVLRGIHGATAHVTSALLFVAEPFTL
jgi:hypothetical protein